MSLTVSILPNPLCINYIKFQSQNAYALQNFSFTTPEIRLKKSNSYLRISFGNYGYQATKNKVSKFYSKLISQ